MATTTTTLDSGAYLPESPSQTAGPYVHIGLIPHPAGFDIYENNLGAGAMAGPGAKGERVRIEGRIFDGAGGLVRDALVEAWQADANAEDPVRNRAAPPRRRRALLARRDTARPGGAAAYVFDIRLQGPDET